MSPAARAGGKRHKVAYVGGGLYDVSWQYEVKYAGSRILHHRSITRTVDLAGAMRFARKWKVPIANAVQLVARRVKANKATAFMPDLVAVILDGRKDDEGALLVCGWMACAQTGTDEPSKCDRWPAGRLAREMRSIERQWRDLHGSGWKLEARS